jgi:hypothetical protein
MHSDWGHEASREARLSGCARLNLEPLGAKSSLGVGVPMMPHTLHGGLKGG